MFFSGFHFLIPLRGYIHKQDLLALSPIYFQFWILNQCKFIFTYLISSLLQNTRTANLLIMNLSISKNEYMNE